MSLIILNVDEVRRTLSASGGAFVTHDKEVDIVRFAINSGFADIVLDGQVALRVMYQRPGETEVRAQTLTYYDTDGLHNYYDWHLLSADLAEKGTLTVALCILRTDSEVEEWHTIPYQIRVLDTIHTDDSDEADETITPTVAQRVAVLETMIQRVASGAPIVVSSVSEMTDTEQIYVLSTNGRWYYHNGTAWVAGGEYGAVATDTTLTQSGMPADAKKVGGELTNLKVDLSDIVEIETATVDKSAGTKLSAYVSGSGNIGSNNDCKLVYVGCLPSTTYTINKVLSTRFRAGYTAVTPAIGGAASGLIENNDGTSINITTGESAQYLVVYYYDGANDSLTESAIYDSLTISYRTDITAVDKVARNGKVDKQQAVADSGKVLAVNATGLVVPTEFSGGLSDEAKGALLACFEKVAWVDDDGHDYYVALHEALYREPYVPEWGNDYTWLYRADSGELFSENENVSSFTIDTGATEELVNNTLHLSSVCTGGEPAVRYHLSPTTNTVGRLTVKVKFNSIPKLQGGGGGMRMQISGGSSGARLMQKHDLTDNKYYVSVKAGSQGQSVAEIQLNTWYILAVELDNGVQKLYLDGTLVFTSSSLNSYATDNQLFVQAPQDRNAGDIDVNIAWITYKNGDVTS